MAKETNKESMDQICLALEQAKAIEIKKLYQQSFYGILGVHSRSDIKGIENGFKIRLRAISASNNLDGSLPTVLKAYATLTSSYKKDYDEYLRKYESALVKAIELFYEKGSLTEISPANIQHGATGKGIAGKLMQPWAVSSDKI